MKLKDYTKEELEAMSYDDIAYIILNESKKKMKINSLFQQICDLLELPERVFTDKIGDFFEVLSTDKRFIMLPDGYWDLKNKYSGSKIIIDEDDDEVLADALEEDDDYGETDEEDVYYEADETDDQEENDLKDLVIIDEEENNELN